MWYFSLFCSLVLCQATWRSACWCLAGVRPWSCAQLMLGQWLLVSSAGLSCFVANDAVCTFCVDVCVPWVTISTCGYAAHLPGFSHADKKSYNRTEAMKRYIQNWWPISQVDKTLFLQFCATTESCDGWFETRCYFTAWLLRNRSFIHPELHKINVDQKKKTTVFASSPSKYSASVFSSMSAVSPVRGCLHVLYLQ